MTTNGTPQRWSDEVLDELIGSKDEEIVMRCPHCGTGFTDEELEG